MSATEGKAVCIVIKVSEEFQPTVTWYHNGEPIEEDYAHEIEADGSLILPSVEVDHSGIYKALVTNENGSVKREMKLTVIEEGRKTKTALSKIVYTRPIPVSEFVKYVAELHTNSDKPFKDLYQVSIYKCGQLVHTPDPNYFVFETVPFSVEGLLKCPYCHKR